MTTDALVLVLVLAYITNGLAFRLGRWSLGGGLQARDEKIADLTARLQRRRRQLRAAHRTVDRLATILLAHGVDAREVRLLVDEERVLARPAPAMRGRAGR